MSDEILDGVVRPGLPPPDAVRPEVVIRAEDGTVVQAAVRYGDTLVEFTIPDVDAVDPDDYWVDRSVWDQIAVQERVRMAASLQVIDPRSLIRLTGS